MKVSFKLNNAKTQLGEQIFIVGNLQNIGSWNLDRASEMETNSLIHPAWITSSSAIITSRFEATNCEYKYINCQIDHFKQKQRVTWETGPNRKIDLSQFYDKNQVDYELLIEDPGFDLGKNDRPLIHEYYKNAFGQSYISNLNQTNNQNQQWDKIKLDDDTSEFLTDFYDHENRGNFKKLNMHGSPEDSMNIHSDLDINQDIQINQNTEKRLEYATAESAMSNISHNMANLHKLPQNFSHKRRSHLELITKDLRDLRKSENLSVSREISQINRERLLSPKQHKELVQYNLNHNDTANFNIEEDDEGYIKELMKDMNYNKSSSPFKPASSQQRSPIIKKSENRYQNEKQYDTDDGVNPLQDQDVKIEFNYVPPMQTPDNQKTNNFRDPKKTTSDFDDQIKQDTPQSGTPQTNTQVNFLTNRMESAGTFAKPRSILPVQEINLVNDFKKSEVTISRQNVANTTGFHIETGGSNASPSQGNQTTSNMPFSAKSGPVNIPVKVKNKYEVQSERSRSYGVRISKVSMRSRQNPTNKEKSQTDYSDQNNSPNGISNIGCCITIESMTGPSCQIDEIDDYGQTTVGLLKDAVCHCLNLPDWVQRNHVQLIFNGLSLIDDESVLEDYEIKQGCKINYIIMIA